VLDFGISKLLNSATLAQTAGSQVLGSPLYMSPEQWRSARDVDARTDIWSLGVVLFELLTGRVPFDGESLPTLCMQISNTQPAPPSKYVPEIAPALDAVVLACLEKDAVHRPENVGALVRALEPFATARAMTSSQRIVRLQPTGEIPPSSPRLGAERTPTEIADTVAIHSRTVAPAAPSPGTTGPEASFASLPPVRWTRVLPLLGVAGVLIAFGITRAVSLAQPVAAAAASPSFAAVTPPPLATTPSSSAPPLTEPSATAEPSSAPPPPPAPTASSAPPPPPAPTASSAPLASSRPRPLPRNTPAPSVIASAAPPLPPVSVAPSATTHLLGASRR
jgi:serine/threonine-protein kinase